MTVWRHSAETGIAILVRPHRIIAGRLYAFRVRHGAHFYVLHQGVFPPAPMGRRRETIFSSLPNSALHEKPKGRPGFKTAWASFWFLPPCRRQGISALGAETGAYFSRKGKVPAILQRPHRVAVQNLILHDHSMWSCKIVACSRGLAPPLRIP